MTTRASRSSAELLHEIRTRMAEDPSWSEPFERLAQEISRVDPLSSNEDTLTCAEIQHTLDVVVTDEMAGVDVDQRHQDVLTHLARCRDCRLTYKLLHQMLSAEPSHPTPVRTPASIRSTAQPSGDDVTAHIFPQIIEVAREVIGRALSGPQMAFARGEADRGEDLSERATLLHTAIVPTAQGDFVTEVLIHRRLDRPGLADLEVRLVSDWALPDDLEARLSWAGLECSEPVIGEGAAHFRDIPLPGLTESETYDPVDGLTVAITRSGKEAT